MIYCSQAAHDVSPDELVALLEQARASNEKAHLSGMLLYCSQSFLQVLEGDEDALRTTYARIAADDRHDHLRVLQDVEVVARLFPDWTMGFEHVDDEELAEELEGFAPETDYPLVNPDLITNAPATSAEVLARADSALCAATSAGKDRAVPYQRALAARDALEEEIARALDKHEFELHYQPVIDLRDGDVTGFEALIRWNRPGHGLVAPDSFIPAAEASALICDIGRWALQEAAGQLARWSTEGLDGGTDIELQVAVNVSGRHVASAAIVDDVEAALAASGVAPDRLVLELTETMLTDGALAGVHLAAVLKEAQSPIRDPYWRS